MRSNHFERNAVKAKPTKRSEDKVNRNESETAMTVKIPKFRGGGGGSQKNLG